MRWQSSSQYADPWATWTCNLCGCDNWANWGSVKSCRSCKTCGGKKSYSQTVSGSAARHATTNIPASSSNPINQKLESIAALLQEAAPKASTYVDLQKYSASAEGNAVLMASKHCTTTEITVLEDTLNKLPAESDLRASIEAQIAAKKRLIIESKPVGARLDACKLALMRADRRKEQAREAVSLAQATLISAEEEHAKLAIDLTQLEAAVSSQVEASSPGENMSSAMEAVQGGFNLLLGQLKGCDGAQEEHIKEAEKRMTELFMGMQTMLTKLSPEQDSEMKDSSGQPTEPNTRRRLTSKVPAETTVYQIFPEKWSRPKKIPEKWSRPTAMVNG